MEAPDLTEEVSVVDTVPVFVGTYSYIFKGDHRGLAVAVKVLRPLSVTMHAMRRKLRRELEVWAHMDHPNIVPLLGYTSESKLFGPLGAFISPWYPNGDAAIFLGLHGNEMTIDERKTLWQDVVAGVCYLHTNTPVIVHGDLKPKNILIDDQGIAKICDFGLVHIFLEEGHSGHTTTSEHTGTDRYLAYELVLSQDASQLSTASDVYALGCVGLEFLFLQIPHHTRKSNRFGEIFQDIRNGVPPASRPSFVSLHDAYLWNILESCWMRLPDDRATARDIQKSLLNTLLVPSAQDSIITGLHEAVSMDIDAIDFPFTTADEEARFPHDMANLNLLSGSQLVQPSGMNAIRNSYAMNVGNTNGPKVSTSTSFQFQVDCRQKQPLRIQIPLLPHFMSYRPLAPVLERPSLFDFHGNTSFSSTLGMQQGKRAEVDEKLLHEAFTQVSVYPDKGLRALLEIIWSDTFYLDENLEPVQGSELAEQIFAQVRQVVPDDPRFASCANGDSRIGTSSANGEQAGSTGEAQSIYMLFTENNMCLICGNKTDRITSALGHVRSDIGHRPFRCDCQKCSSSPNPRRFFSEILLYLHQKGQAVIRICPICPICGNEIRGSLLRHMHSEHADHPESPYREK